MQDALTEQNSPHPWFTDHLNCFDSKFNSLVDYFCVIGFDTCQLQALVRELLNPLDFDD